MAYTPSQKHLLLTLGFLRQQRTQIDGSIALLEAFTGQKHTNGHGNGIMKLAADALAIHEEVNGHAHAPKHRGKGARGVTVTGRPRQRALAAMKPLPQVAVPSGLNVEGMKLEEAIPVALKAYKKPADTKHLTALLLGAGFKWDRPAMPFSTRVGSLCGRAKKEMGLKGDRNGWSLRG